MSDTETEFIKISLSFSKKTAGGAVVRSRASGGRLGRFPVRRVAPREEWEE